MIPTTLLEQLLDVVSTALLLDVVSTALLGLLTLTIRGMPAPLPAPSPLSVSILTMAGIVALPCLLLHSRCPVPAHPSQWRRAAPKPGPTDET